MIFGYLSSFTRVQQISAWILLSAVLASWLREFLLPLVFILATALTHQTIKFIGACGKSVNPTPLLFLFKVLKKCYHFSQTLLTRLTLCLYGSDANHFNKAPVKLFTPQLEIQAFLHLVLRDFIKDWYKLISTHIEFTDQTKQLLETLAENLIERISKIDLHRTVEDAIRLFECHLRDCRQAQQSFKQQPVFRSKRTEARLEYKKIKDISHAFRRLPCFHPALKDLEKEPLYVCHVIEEILNQLIPFHVLQCHPAKAAVTEILAKNVVCAFADIAQNPHWIHEVIILILADPVQEFEYVGDREEDFCDMLQDLVRSIQAEAQTEAESNPSSSEPSRPAFDIVDGDLSADLLEVVRPQPEGIANPPPLVDSEPVLRLRGRSHSLTDISIHQPRHRYLSESQLTSSLTEIDQPRQRSRFDSAEVDAADEAMAQLDGATHGSPELLFEEVSIPSTELSNEQGTLHLYTLYTIEALAWYPTPWKSWVLKPLSVRRRYREFVTLQDRLEDHPKYGRLMKSIKGPKRWHALPFRNLNDSMIERRRTFLESYLRVLIHREAIGKSLALRDFLAYEGDANIAFVRKATEVLRLDKILLRTVSGVFRHLSQGLEPPSHTTVEGLPGPSASRRSITRSTTASLTHDTDAIRVSFTYPQNPADNLVERAIKRCINEGGMLAYDQSSAIEVNEIIAEDNDEFKDTIEEFDFRCLRRSDGDGCDHSRDTTMCDQPMTEAVLDLAMQALCMQESWIQHTESLHFVKVLLGSTIEQILKEEIHDVTTLLKCSQAVYNLRETLWPHGMLDTSPPPVVSDDEMMRTRQDAVDGLVNFLPSFIPLLIGPNAFRCAIEDAVACFDHPKMNRHLFYTLLDFLLVTVLPEIDVASLQQRLYAADPHCP